MLILFTIPVFIYFIAKVIRAHRKYIPYERAKRAKIVINPSHLN